MSTPIPSIPGYQTSAFYHPASQASGISGDFYDVVALEDGRYALVMADISGKGYRAAVHRDLLLRTVREFAAADPAPRAVLQRLNSTMLNASGSDQFVTLFYGLLDPNRNLLTYASAGHEPMVAVMSGGQMQLLESTGTVLGAAADVFYSEQTVPTESLEVLVLYTDGVTDARALDSQDRFGLARLLSELNLHWAGTAADLLKAILQAVFSFAQGNCSDDTSILILRRDASAAAQGR